MPSFNTRDLCLDYAPDAAFCCSRPAGHEDSVHIAYAAHDPAQRFLGAWENRPVTKTTKVFVLEGGK